VSWSGLGGFSLSKAGGPGGDILLLAE
jgi:hypothetical protein